MGVGGGAGAPHHFAHAMTPPAEWAGFREQLIGLTDVTRTHFDKLVAELERGLDDLAGVYAAGVGGGEEEEEGGVMGGGGAGGGRAATSQPP